MNRILPLAFFDRPTLTVAHDLVGKYLHRKIGPKVVAVQITEVEAYVGPHDLASHASKGRTPRTDVMYRRAGTIYVYFIYGRYWMLNIVTEAEEYPAAVLIRGAGSFRGPGILTRELQIDNTLNGMTVGKRTGLWFEDRGALVGPRAISKMPRIGIDYAGPVWARKKYRFLMRGGS